MLVLDEVLRILRLIEVDLAREYEIKKYCVNSHFYEVMNQLLTIHLPLWSICIV